MTFIELCLPRAARAALNAEVLERCGVCRLKSFVAGFSAPLPLQQWPLRRGVKFAWPRRALSLPFQEKALTALGVFGRGAWRQSTSQKTEPPSSRTVNHLSPECATPDSEEPPPPRECLKASPRLCERHRPFRRLERVDQSLSAAGSVACASCSTLKQQFECLSLNIDCLTFDCSLRIAGPGGVGELGADPT